MTNRTKGDGDIFLVLVAMLVVAIFATSYMEMYFSTISLIVSGLTAVLAFVVSRYSTGFVDWTVVYGIALLFFLFSFVWEMTELFLLPPDSDRISTIASAIFQMFVIVGLVLIPES